MTLDLAVLIPVAEYRLHPEVARAMAIAALDKGAERLGGKLGVITTETFGEMVEWFATVEVAE